jgi:hypothetical protein
LPTGTNLALVKIPPKTIQPEADMKITRILIAAISINALTHAATAQDVTFFFETDVSPSVTGGNLVLTDTGTGPTNTWESDRFEAGSSTFEIQSIPIYGTLTVTANSLIGDLNVTEDGLADGGSGYNASGEGTSFTFSQDVTITGFDFAAFTTAGSDSIELSIGASSLGTFSDGTVIAGVADFTNTNAVIASIDVSAGQVFSLARQDGSFHLQTLSFTVVPEPGTFALLAGFSALASVMFRRRALK